MDALSRSISEISGNCIDIISGSQEKQILEIHKELGHRKSIQNDLNKRGVEINQHELGNILAKCVRCMERDKKYVHSNRYIETRSPGEIVGIDLMEYKDSYVIIMIDYFTRKLFARIITTKVGRKIVNFLEFVHTQFPFKKIISDGGKEFNNRLIKEWMRENRIDHHIRPPYYSKGSGRVERAIRTLRTALNKTAGTLRLKLQKVVDGYNQSIHRAISISPNEAVSESNWGQVIRSIESYKREFRFKELPKLKQDQDVYIRNEVMKSKDEKSYNRTGIVIKALERDTYLIKDKTGKQHLRHFSQLKDRPGML